MNTSDGDDQDVPTGQGPSGPLSHRPLGWLLPAAIFTAMVSVSVVVALVVSTKLHVQEASSAPAAGQQPAQAESAAAPDLTGQVEALELQARQEQAPAEEPVPMQPPAPAPQESVAAEAPSPSPETPAPQAVVPALMLGEPSPAPEQPVAEDNAAAEAEAEPPAPEDVDVDAFARDLQPLGRWVQVPEYAGRCWVPHGITSDWRPYTVGRWAYTTCGLTWVSDEPWGSITYHYGIFMSIWWKRAPASAAPWRRSIRPFPPTTAPCELSPPSWSRSAGTPTLSCTP